MPGISERRFRTTVQGPAVQALELLAVHSEEVLAKWRRNLTVTGQDDLLIRIPLEFERFSGALRKCTYPAFRKRIREFGSELASRGVALEHSTAALSQLFEICVQVLLRRENRRASVILALARLHTLILLLVIAGYDGRRPAGAKTLVGSASEIEDRGRGAAAYVTKIYEQERNRLSQDLHDEVGHDLIVIKLYLELIALDLKDHDLENIKPRLTEAIALVAHAIESVRRLVHDLGPAVFDELGFLPAVRTYVNQFSARTKIPLTLREGYIPEDIPMSHQVALYRLLQGALSNVLKHASATSVKVSLGCMKDSVVIMVIQDDGVGFDTAAKPGRRSFGLTAMRERIEVLGGRIHIQSMPARLTSQPRGTRIEVDLPLPGGMK